MENDYKDFLIKQRDTQTKFDYFLVSVTLAFIMITFQTHGKLVGDGFDYIKILSWISMLLSFSFGIYRLRRFYVFQGIEADYINLTQNYGSEKELIEKAKKGKSKEQKKIGFSGKIQIYSFGFGIVLFLLFIIASFYPTLFSWLKLFPQTKPVAW